MPFSKHIRIGLCTFFAAFAAIPGAGAATMSKNERTLLETVNDVRAAHNLQPLEVDTTLVRAARDYSTTLIRRDIFTHGALGPRLASYGARGTLFGENLAWGTGRKATARSIVGSWLASPGHRANLLRPSWKRVGIGSRTGEFLGYYGATVVTADFAG
jgi:uncharacterized protein YkwD